MLDKLKCLFYKLPDDFKKILYLFPMEVRLGGGTFRQLHEFLHTSEGWSQNKLRRFQALQLRKLLYYAVKNIPFYSNINLTGDPFRDIKRFPIVNKDTIQQNLSDFISNNMARYKAHLVTTGGTSGRQLRFYLDNSVYAKEWAFMITLWERVGYKLGDRIISIRGVEFRRTDRGIYWQKQPVYNALELSPFHMNPETLPLYIEKIKEWRPRFIHGYPSAITILAKYILNSDVKGLPRIKGLLLASENLYPWQRKLLEEAFKARAFSWYGQSEKVILAGECEFSSKYHVFPEYGYTELLGRDGSVIEEPGEEGELVGTGFLNYAMPFIRYRTGDYAKLSEEQACACGRHYKLIEDVKGRWLQEMVVGKHGSLISLTALNIHSNELNKVYNFQFFQDKPGEVTLRLKVNKSFKKEDEKRIIEAFKRKVGNELDIAIEKVNEIELAPSGKTRFLIQKLNLMHWWKLIE